MLKFLPKRWCRMLGAVALFSLAAYLITPETAAGPNGDPVGFAFNLRYLAPALTLSLAVAPLAPALAGPTSTDGNGGRARDRARRHRGRSRGCGRARTPAGRSSSASRRSRCSALLAVAQRSRARPTIAIATVAALVVAGAAAGYPLQRHYLRGRYAYQPNVSYLAHVWALFRTVHDSRVGVVGTFGGFFSYPFYGLDVSNRVQYVAQRGPHGSFTPISTCARWRAQVNSDHLKYLITTPARDPWHPTVLSILARDPVDRDRPRGRRPCSRSRRWASRSSSFVYAARSTRPGAHKAEGKLHSYDYSCRSAHRPGTARHRMGPRPRSSTAKDRAGAERMLEEGKDRGVEVRSRDYAGKVAELDAAALQTAMRELEEINELIGRAGSYASLEFATDTADPARGALLQLVQERATEIETLLLFFDLEWAAVDDEKAEELLASDELDRYRHHLRSVRRYRPHLLSESEEKILAEKSISSQAAWGRLFGELVGGAPRRPRRNRSSRSRSRSAVSSHPTGRSGGAPRTQSRRRSSRACARAGSSTTRSCSTSRSRTGCGTTRTGWRAATFPTRRPTSR